MKKFAMITTLTGTAMMLAACGSENGKHANHGSLIVKVSDTNPTALIGIGEMKVEELGKKGVSLKIRVEGLEPGSHAMHLHETGRCEGPDFKSAGGHYNPTGVAHGSVENGPHAGDMMNIEIAVDETGTFSVTNPNVSLHGDYGLPALRDEDGTALIIHAKADDYTSQPSGAAGPRVACSVIGLK